MNKIVIIGRTVRDCSYTQTTNELPLCKFVIASKNSLPSEENNTDFIKCVATNKNADIMVKYVHKGDLISLSGELRTRRYEAEGKMQEKDEVFIDKIELLAKNQKTETTINPIEEPKLPF